jgi:hypothetical protein
MSSLQEDIIAPAEMGMIHAAMIHRSCGFEHVGRFDNYGSYQAHGIYPQDPNRSDGVFDLTVPPIDVISARVVCLKPINSTPSTPNRGDQQFRMAFRSCMLPERIGLDISHTRALSKAVELRVPYPAWANSEIFVEIAHDLGSFVSYDPIRLPALRVHTRDCSVNNPQTWPLLAEAEQHLVETFV